MLFGSFARGRGRPDSDVDIAVVGDEVDVLGLSAELAVILLRDVDVVAVTLASPIPLLRALLRDARTVYERSPGSAASFLSRARMVNELDTPNHELMMQRFMSRVARRGVGP